MDTMTHESVFADLDTQNLGLCESEESSIIFQNGIEATDMGSLLEQFEAAESFPSSLPFDILPELGFENSDMPIFETLDLSEVCEVPPSSPAATQCSTAAHVDAQPGKDVTMVTNQIPPDSEVVKLLTSAYVDAQPGKDVTMVTNQIPPDSEVVKLLKAPSRTKHVPLGGTMPPIAGELRKSMKHTTGVRSVADSRKDVRPQSTPRNDQIKNKAPSSTSGTANIKKIDKKRRLSFNQYRQRLRQKMDKENSDSVDSVSSGSSVGAQHVACDAYFRVNIDHNYCQNGLVRAPSAPPPDAIKLEANQSTDQLKHTIEPGNAENDATLKNLLLSNNLSNELKAQAKKDRAVTRKNMTTSEQCHKEAGQNIGSTQNQYSSQQKLSEGEVGYLTTSDNRQALMDKLPSYCTTLAVHSIPGMAIKKSGSACKFVDQALPVFDRDPSPERSDPIYNKIPAYFSEFTNSSKYDHIPPSDRSFQPDLKDKPYPWDTIRSELPKYQPTCCDSPLIESRSRPRARSDKPRHRRLWRQRNYRYRTGSVSSRSRSKTRSRSSSSSSSSCASCYSRGHSRGPSRSHSPQRAGHSSDDSKSSHRNKSPSRNRDSSGSACSWSCTDDSSHSPRRSRNHSSSKYRSRSRVRNRTCHASRSGSAYRSRSPLREYMKSRSRSRRSRSREHSDTYRTLIQKNREREKAQKIEERRIVYVGRIPNGTLRQDLRRKFSYFGEIEEVSVHFREHGDNYGFVTFVYTCDAYAAVEQGNTLPDCTDYEFCFGGRRQFCKNEYADLDGDMEEDEEMGSAVTTQSLDFDSLLRQARQSIN